jgi:DNA invertase Pin-like site-specific DNA recombinase
MTKQIRAALYLRVSTDRQTVENQRLRLTEVAKFKGHEIVAEFKDEGISGSKGRKDRPGLDAALNAARKHSYDILYVWSLDRLGRSTIDLLKTSAALKEAGREIYFDRDQIDTTTDHGEMFFTIMAAIGEFERKQIVARVKAGLRRAVADGKVLGRRTVEDSPEGAAKVAKARKLLKAGQGINKVAAAVGLGGGTVQRIKAEMM